MLTLKKCLLKIIYIGNIFVQQIVDSENLGYLLSHFFGVILTRPKKIQKAIIIHFLKNTLENIIFFSFIKNNIYLMGRHLNTVFTPALLESQNWSKVPKRCSKFRLGPPPPLTCCPK